mgnify:FL=1
MLVCKYEMISSEVCNILTASAVAIQYHQQIKIRQQLRDSSSLEEESIYFMFSFFSDWTHILDS